jgi:hypothetical protein
MNSVYGVFYEKNERIIESNKANSTEIDGHLLRKSKDNPGRYFHPFLAGWITSKTRVQLYNAGMQHPEDLIFFATDGILSHRKLNLSYSDELGQWDHKSIQEARVFGNGIYELDGKLKSRGFRKDASKDSRPLHERMTERNGQIFIEVEEMGPIHLNQSFRLRDYSKKDALTWISKHKDMNITQCKKRHWPEFTIHDIYNTQIPSTPRSIQPEFNRNPGLVWKGDSGNVPNLANRFTLGALQMEVHD